MVNTYQRPDLLRSKAPFSLMLTSGSNGHSNIQHPQVPWSTTTSVLVSNPFASFGVRKALFRRPKTGAPATPLTPLLHDRLIVPASQNIQKAQFRSFPTFCTFERNLLAPRTLLRGGGHSGLHAAERTAVSRRERVRFHPSPDSLNSRFLPMDGLSSAVFAVDDDIRVSCDDLGAPPLEIAGPRSKVLI